jgi:adenosylmethionine-8-amino-7-oxononanoate aminotransferase
MKQEIEQPGGQEPVKRPPENHIFYRDLNKDYLMISHAKGIYLYDQDGREIIDGAAGAAVVSLGHGNERVIGALHEQAKKLAFTHLSMFTNEPIITLSNLLHERLPEGLDRVYLASGGSEAVEAAIKLMRQYHLENGDHDKHKVISRTISYHGATIGALSMTGHHFRRGPYSPLLRSYPRIPPPYCYRCSFHKKHPCGPPECDLECAYELERAILTEGQELVGAFIYEPVIGASAPAVAPPKGYQKITREICDKYGILMIADEIMSGYGRTGKFLATKHYEKLPDIVTLSKCMSSGYTPLGAMVCNEKIFDVLKNVKPGKFIHGHTFGGNPLSAAVGVEVLRIMKEKHLVERVAKYGKLFKQLIDEMKEKHRMVGDARAIGLLGGLEFVQNRRTKKPFPPEKHVASLVQKTSIEHGLYTYPGTGSVDNVAGDHILLAPPYIIKREQLEKMFEVLDKALTEVENHLKSESLLK